VGAAEGEALLAARGLCLDRADGRLIDRVDLEIRAGERAVLMGPNGAGKSLLLRLLHGLLAPSAGEVTWMGRPAGAEARAGQAMVFQRPVMLRRSALANLRFALSVRGIRGAERRRREAEALARAGLAHLARRPARVLSAGEQQRLAVARALSSEPRMLFLDEPTASLDPASTLAIEGLVLEAQAAGVAVLMVTHDVGQARRLAERVLFLHGGRIADSGAAAEVLDRPRSAAVRAWLDGRPLAAGAEA